MADRLLYVAGVIIVAWCVVWLALALVAAWVNWCQSERAGREWLWDDFERKMADWERMRQEAKDHRKDRDGI